MLETYVVTRAKPLKFTVEPATKLEPLTVSVNPGSLVLMKVGLIEVIVGILLVMLATVVGSIKV